MRAAKYRVKLSNEERQQLRQLLGGGIAASRQLTRARILLKADESGGQGWTDGAIMGALEVSANTIAKVRKTYVEAGLEGVLQRKESTRNYERRLDGAAEAQLVALTCSQPPAGYGRWSLRLLADKLVELAVVEQVSHETVRQVLQKTHSSRG